MPPKYPSYSSLNKIERPLISERVDFDDYSAKSLFNKISVKIYNPSAIDNTGPYKAVVLRIESKSTITEPGSWVSGFFRFGESKLKTPNLIKVRARIPEIHSMLPIPNTLGQNAEEEDQAIMDMYPVFIAQSSDLQEPAVGSIIWVDFENKKNFTGPIYLKSYETSTSTDSSSGVTNPSKIHNEVCSGDFVLNNSCGDSLSGRNVQKSHSDIPMGKIFRKRNETKIIQGNRVFSKILSSWKSVSKEMRGITFLGGVSFNGEEDIYHEAGKRDTLIFVPETTDCQSQTELMIILHDDKQFSESFFKLIKDTNDKFLEQHRNIVIVIPELSNSFYSQRVVRKSWKTAEEFSSYLREIEKTLRNNVNKEINISYKSLISLGKGCETILEVVDSFSSIGFDRIILSNPNKDSIIQKVYEKYITLNNKRNLVLLSNDLEESQESVENFVSNNSPLSEFVIRENVKNVSKEQLYMISMAYVSQKSNVQSSSENSQISDSDIAKEEKQSIEESFKEISQDKKIPLNVNGEHPHPLQADRSPSYKPKSSDTKFSKKAIIKDSIPFEESRVKLNEYGTLSAKENMDLLQKVPTTKSTPVYVHKLAAKRFFALNESWMRENPGEPEIRIVSGLRPAAFDSWEDYEKFAIREYGSVEEARKYKAFNSPHQTGLAFDIGNLGLYPNRKTIKSQKQTRLYDWLVNNAHRFGITPYKVEPWHWEVRLPYESWALGEEFTNNLAVRVEDVGQSKELPQKKIMNEQNNTCVASLGSLNNKLT